jgi:glycerophosphoryl diester phosphodiesterase
MKNLKILYLSELLFQNKIVFIVISIVLSVMSCNPDNQTRKEIAIMGHRGGPSWAPENTLAAFRMCADNDIAWETDLNLTADGEIVLLHDMTLDRTTDAETVFNSQNIPVYSKTLKQIKTLDAGSFFNNEFAGEKVPTLDELLDCFVAYAGEGSVISMDTKLDGLSPETEVYQSIIDKIASRNLFDRVFIEVYSVEGVHKTKDLINGDKLKYAIWVRSDTVLLNSALASGYFSRIHASGKIAFKADDIHAAGVPFFSCHPINSQSDWDAVKEFNIDGVSTDKADIAKYVVKNEISLCRITYPLNGSGFSEGENITIIARVADSDSSISKVEFYKSGSLVGTDTSFPYSCSWSDIPKGSYTLTAEVYDNDMKKLSFPVKIKVD